MVTLRLNARIHFHYESNLSELTFISEMISGGIKVNYFAKLVS